MSYLKNKSSIPGTTMFDGEMAQKGYGLNKMCHSLNGAEGREAFLADEMAYCDKYGLTEAQKTAIKERDVLGLLQEGGSIYYLAKFVGMLGLNMQDIGALQTGMSVEEFKQMLLDAGK
ncbi:protocatechuate 4,5-dioxygenase subunit alpha [Vibrio coralliilyticus]|jgi:protocatechuate 4,5-dioxygenase alpha chain|uniref:Protocatechuate 4,5-dioxygenase subunit alpha n=2 Tax=Vibrio coralliilyticus TaxID=190893 RepID=A0AAP6ZP86_9VIBR|nr:MULTISPECIES: protocatechuate 4,5-dioxygenase subunit alpha [Vibrio]ANW25944.1 protocatechuate 3,4-dioxygenase [Vibrio coralliilyticus]NOJ25681.1 protocatechuate 4,5-dioxygenase subunit alpha [Vibrio coralliilyticus]NRF23392.1 protocatechuate 4,5-dioxygenase subunit alpha [Vibrio coralliilyticus]NRF77898.1 protocatechuate 4,5-dioxygenase subunit alpha [Vibrio coralliilyticus]USD42657.1 protocatechuate 4,5-dioxygenase subunit alpha [Vibrio sp. SCSIO 43135]